MSEFDRRVAPTFAAQLGLMTRRQVFAAGGNKSTIRRRVASGQWSVAERGVYALEGVPWTWRRNLGAVVLSVKGALASHRSAAKLLGATPDDRGGLPPVELSVPTDRFPERDFPGCQGRMPGVPVIVHESVDLSSTVPILVDGIPTTPPLRLALDLGSVVPFDHYRRVVGVLRRDHGVDWVSLDRIYRRHSAQGRNGCGALRDLLERHFGQAGAPDEVVELRCADLLVAAGLPVPEHQYKVTRPDGRVARFDLAYPACKIAIETDGKLHNEDEVRQGDNRRRNNVQLLGWTVFHFSWEDVTYHPEYVVATVRDALREAGGI